MARDFALGVHKDLTPPRVLCGDPTLDDDDFCLAMDLEGPMRDAGLRFLDGEDFGSGASGIMKMRVELSSPTEPLVIDAKWKPGPRSFSGLNNSPRKEVAAFRVQRLFLPPGREVVPPTVVRCEPTRPGRPLPANRAGGDRIPCVLGVLSYWVRNIDNPKDVDLKRFAEDLAYRTAIADLNVFMHIIDHRDTHDENWYLSTDADRVRSLSVDNGVAFSGLRNFNRSTDWAEIHVPAIARSTVERLRAVRSDQVQALRALGSWVVTDEGLEPVELPDYADGVSFDGVTLRHGLTEAEASGVMERITALVARVDSGELPTFDDGVPAQPAVADDSPPDAGASDGHDDRRPVP